MKVASRPTYKVRVSDAMSRDGNLEYVHNGSPNMTRFTVFMKIFVMVIVAGTLRQTVK